MYYIITICALTMIYPCAAIFLEKIRNTRLVDLVFFTIVYGCYLTFVLIVFADVGITDWNFLNTLPVANVSPFMFFGVPMFYLLPNKARRYYRTLISLLSVGMFLSPVFNCIYNARIDYAFHPHLLLDYVAHFALSLWGIYLVRSGRVTLHKKDCLISGAVLPVVAVILLVVNCIFDTAFFGLSLYGKHNIYNIVLVSDPYLSALIYFCGLITVLYLGYLLQSMLHRLPSGSAVHPTESA